MQTPFINSIVLLCFLALPVMTVATTSTTQKLNSFSDNKSNDSISHTNRNLRGETTEDTSTTNNISTRDGDDSSNSCPLELELSKCMVHMEEQKGADHSSQFVPCSTFHFHALEFQREQEETMTIFSSITFSLDLTLSVRSTTATTTPTVENMARLTSLEAVTDFAGFLNISNNYNIIESPMIIDDIDEKEEDEEVASSAPLLSVVTLESLPTTGGEHNLVVSATVESQQPEEGEQKDDQKSTLVCTKSELFHFDIDLDLNGLRTTTTRQRSTTNPKTTDTEHPLTVVLLADNQ